MKAKIINVEKHSPADKCKIKAGDEVVSLNGKENFDVLDYMMAQADDRIELTLSSQNGEEKTVTIKNPGYLPLGISFENYTVDEPKQCRNNCIFCFMAQMPKGLRETLYFKDDDYRLSFICGNYITLTNVSDEELERIKTLNIGSLNISVHVTDPDLRQKMMRNNTCGNILQRLYKLKQYGVEYNLQFVLCPGINDGEYLKKSLEDVLTLIPAVRSVSCVPVGLTKFRQGLYPLRSYTKAEAQQIVNITEEFAEKAGKIDGTVSLCASDEFYLLAEKEFPRTEYYKEYLQFENGVGMARSFIDDVDSWLKDEKQIKKDFSAYIITGILGEKVIKKPIEKINQKFGTDFTVKAVKNEFFGESVTAGGLVCGSDIMKQMNGTKLPLVIPANMLKDDEDVFLDDTSVNDIEKALGVKCYIVTPNADGMEELIRSID